MSSECIFCKIVAGEIPSMVLYSDQNGMVIMDINPIAKGHCLIIPRNHAETIETADVTFHHLTHDALKKVLPALKKAVGAEGFNIITNVGAVAGQMVPHVHTHIIPRFTGDKNKIAWNPLGLQKDEISKIAESIKQHI